MGVALGCQTNTDLRIDGNDQFTPSGQISYEFYPGVAQRRSGTLLDLVTGSAEDPMEAIKTRTSPVQGTIAIEGAMAAVEGSDHQQVAAGERVELDVVIVGPERVKLDAENLRGQIDARGGLRIYDVLSLEGIMGLGVDSTEVRLRGDGVDGSDEKLLAGFLVGARGTVRPIPLFDVYVQYLASFSESWTTIEDTMVAGELNLTRNISLFAGYRWWEYKNTDFNGESDWKINLRGPTAGASLKF
jgi:opacity protein-like surface antigen